MTAEEKAHPELAVIPRYWVPAKEVETRLDNSEGADIIRSTLWPNWRATRSPQDRQSYRRTDRDFQHDSADRPERFHHNTHAWFVAFRGISNSTNERTTILATFRETAMSNAAPLLRIDTELWLQAFRGIARATDERTMLIDNLPESGVGNSAPTLTYEYAQTVASALVLANMNSLPLDWAARFSVGGTHMNFFIVKQLSVPPPETYLEEALPGLTYAELIVPRVLELTYTAHDLQPFARDLGYDGPPFPWDEDRRHRLKCELDAIFAHLYHLDRKDLEWILDAPYPSASFPGLKRNEVRQFGEYRTQRYVLHAYDQMVRCEAHDLEEV